MIKAPDLPTPPEKRKSPRLPLTLPVRIYDRADLTQLEPPLLVATTQNLSATGLYLHTFQPMSLRSGAIVVARLTVPMQLPPEGVEENGAPDQVPIQSDLAAFIDIEHRFCALECGACVLRIDFRDEESMLGTGIALHFDEPLAFAWCPLEGE